MPMITTVYQALPRRRYPLLALRLQGIRRLSSDAGGGERWRGQPQQQQQEESKAVKVSVWWDFQKCQLPPDANPCRVAPRVTAALRTAGIRGPVEITAFGDVFVLPRHVQEVLAATGVAFSHVPTSCVLHLRHYFTYGGKDGSDRSFIADLVYWIAQNPPPAHFFLISGDKNFANILHRLRMSNYNILLACPNTEAGILCSAATIMWPWEALIKGDGFTRKHFNQPPDGLSCSWYGNYRGALDDPFQKAEPKHSVNVPLQTKKPEKTPIVSKSAVNGSDYVKFIDPLPGDRPAVVGEKRFTRMSSGQSIGEVKSLIGTKNEKPRSSNVPSSPSDILSSEQKRIPVGDDPFLQGESKHSMNVPLQTKKPETPRLPRSVVNCIRRALNSYPEGVNLEDLLSELKENRLFKYNGLYGFKNFTALLQAMPDYVKFIDPLSGDNQPAVVGEKSFNRFPSAQSNGEVKCLIETKNEKPSSSNVTSSPSVILSPEQRKIPIVDAPSSQCDLLSRYRRKAPPVDFIKPSEPPACHMEADMAIAAGTPSGVQGPTSKKGLLERIQILWTGPKTIKPQVYPSHDDTCSEGSSDVTRQEGHNTEQHNSHLKRVMKNCSTTENPDGNGPDNSSAVSTSSSNDPSNNCSELDVKGNFANTKNHSGETVEISKAGKIQGSGESNKGIFSWAARWWSSGKSDKQHHRNHANTIDGTRKDSDKGCSFVNSASGHQVGVEMFEKSYFWDALQQYLLTHHGSKLVSEAKTREELAHGLQKGCWLLKGLDEKYIHQLVHLLISEKKWIKECMSETFHFQLTPSQRGTCAPLHSFKSEGLSSLLTNGSTTISSKLFPARNGKDQASSKGNVDQGVDDFAWEELGPVSSASDRHPVIDKVVPYHPPTSSDDEFSDDEDQVADEQAGKDSDAEFSKDENHTASQQARRDPLQSSLLEVIASWETGKDDGSPPRNFKAECSRTNKHYRQCWRPSTKQQQQHS